MITEDDIHVVEGRGLFTLSSITLVHWGAGVRSSLERGSSAAHFLKPSNEFDYAFWGGYGRKIAGVPHWGGYGCPGQDGNRERFAVALGE